MAKLFGTDGVRGVANRELTPEMAMNLGRAGALVLARHSGSDARPTILIGRDTRLSGDMLAAALTAGILSAGASVIDLGIVTTPAVSWLTHRHDVQAGVMISASHNPMEDNGIKFFAHSGYKLSDELEEQIAVEMDRSFLAEERPVGAAVGKLTRAPEMLQFYHEHLVSLPDMDLRGIKLAIDCANGAAYAMAARPFEHLGAEVHLIHHQPDGLNINRGCGSTHMESLQDYVRDHGLHLGLALDGDADRCLAVDQRGCLVDGDQIMAILALDMKAKGRLHQNTVVATVMSNLGFHLDLRKQGIHTAQTKVGDRYVLEEMQKGSYSLGGEQSGHIIIGDYARTGDGLMTGLLLANRLRESGLSLTELSQVVRLLPQTLINVRVADKEKVRQSERFREEERKAEAELGESGRLLIRPSGTEPLLRIMVEAGTQAEAERIASHLAEVAKRVAE